MNLRDWLSNNNLVMKKIPGDDRANRGPMKILGLTWDIESEMIGLNEKKQSQVIANLTKREFLKQISSVYDLLGMFSPVTLQGKVFLQALWNKRLEWDESLPVQDEIQWLKIETNLRELSKCNIPRY